MRSTLSLFGALALLPAMIGPLQAEGRTLAAPLCGGGAMAIPLVAGNSGSKAPPGPLQGPCCAKGCHAGARRKRLDRTQ
jgi:hypothetical protein